MTINPSSVAVIGAGALGRPIAERLIAFGMDVLVCDLDEAKLKEIEAKGARISRSVADCADCETALVVVLTEKQVRDVVSILATRVDHTPLARVAVMSTVPPQAVRDMATVLHPTGVRVLDAPNSGGAMGALAGTLTIMAGGEVADLEGFAPVFEKIARNVFHCGTLGAGQIAKIVNNVLCHANTMLMAEAFRLGMAHGLRPEDMAKIMEVSTGRNFLTARPDLMMQSMSQHAPTRQIFDSVVTVLRKDTRLAANLAAEQKFTFPMIAGVADLIETMGDETFETWQTVAGFRKEN